MTGSKQLHPVNMEPGKNSSFCSRLLFYAGYMWRFAVLRRREPLVYGIALTDQCNLSCRGCRVSGTGRPDMTWDQLQRAMEDAWQRGFRELYFTGGEPMLWSDGDHRLPDLISLAKRIGFFHVHVYTNGLLGIEPDADLVWVSMDGLPGVFETRRGDCFHEVDQAVRSASGSRVAIIYVIDRNTEKGIEPFLDWVVKTEFTVIGVLFYFHTPYYGIDDLFLAEEERALVIDRLLGCIHRGLPLLNSRAGLSALRSDNWPRPFQVASLLDVDGESVCCRFNDGVCRDCGYTACTELTQLQRLRPSTLISMMRYW